MILIANWKMQLGVQESVHAAKEIVKGLPKEGIGAEVILAPSFPALAGVAGVIKNSAITLGAQDCFWQNKGAFTGEVSPAVLRELGCTHVIIGHSERRAMGETDAEASQKIHAVLGEGMTPILCIGESAEERRAGNVHALLERELRGALTGLHLPGTAKLVVAYEPVWAIGTGDPAGSADAAGALATIRMIIPELVTASDLAKIQIIYGGSADHTNIAGFIRAGMQGSLVGGASLRPKEFIAMVKEAVSAV